jgi:hypothetical protein
MGGVMARSASIYAPALFGNVVLSLLYRCPVITFNTDSPWKNRRAPRRIQRCRHRARFGPPAFLKRCDLGTSRLERRHQAAKLAVARVTIAAVHRTEDHPWAISTKWARGIGEGPPRRAPAEHRFSAKTSQPSRRTNPGFLPEPASRSQSITKAPFEVE